MDHITLCGDNCQYCPRFLAKIDEELKKTAELWYKMQWRDTIVSNDEIKCTGCSSHKECTYGLVNCIKEHDVEKCSKCHDFPCNKINLMLMRSDEYKIRAQKVCSSDDYALLEKAFFRKEENLKK